MRFFPAEIWKWRTLCWTRKRRISSWLVSPLATNQMPDVDLDKMVSISKYHGIKLAKYWLLDGYFLTLVLHTGANSPIEFLRSDYNYFFTSIIGSSYRNQTCYAIIEYRTQIGYRRVLKKWWYPPSSALLSCVSVIMPWNVLGGSEIQNRFCSCFTVTGFVNGDTEYVKMLKSLGYPV